MQKTLGKHTVVLLGLGHTNTHILKMWKMSPPPDAELVCISNFPVATYSGMMPGVLASQYQVAEMEIDLVRLCASANVRLILDEVTGIDHTSNEVLFRDRPSVRFSCMSIGIGSRPVVDGVDLEAENSLVAVKPMQTFLNRLRDRFEKVQAAGVQEPTIAVVGGGIGSIEIAFCLHRRIQVDPKSLGLDGGAKIRLITSGAQIGAGLIPATQQRVAGVLSTQGIELLTNSRVSRVGNRELNLNNGETVSADVTIWATNARGPELLPKLGLELDERDFIQTKSTLQTITNDKIFAVGDTGTMIDFDLPKAGVYAVRQGPVLWDNIRRCLSGRKLVQYEPQAGFLKLINTANGKTIAEYGKRSFYGKWCWALKDRIDRKFMKMYQDYTAAMKPTVVASPEETMRCLGCGGKIGGKLLSSVLAELDVPAHDDVVIGLDQPDDAAVLATHNNRVTLTTDFFASPFDDPYLVARIAMLNSLSDCFVMGSPPQAALANVQIPVGHPRSQLQVMRELMAGSVTELKRCGATLIGGHSIEGPRLTIGFTIVGRQDRAPQTKGMLQAGDQLVLTKPLGTGVLLAALMQGKMPGVAYQDLLDSMLVSNQVALGLIDRELVTGITDVTGFGLAGHLTEMLQASEKSASLQLEAIPLLPFVKDLIKEGVQSTLADENRAVATQIQGEVESEDLSVLFDPQTSGGLLLGVQPDKVGPVLECLRQGGHEQAAVIGEVQPDSGQGIWFASNH